VKLLQNLKTYVGNLRETSDGCIHTSNDAQQTTAVQLQLVQN